MAVRNSPIPDSVLLTRVLERIDKRGAVKQSELFDLTGNNGRIEPLLSGLVDKGILSYTETTVGRRVKLYSLTDVGMMLLCIDRMHRDILEHGSELDMESGEMVGIAENIRKLYDVRYR